MQKSRTKVLFLIGHGALGGVERHVQAILRNLDQERFEASVVVLMEGGPSSEEIAATGIPVYILHGRSGSDPRAFYRMMRLLRRVRPQVVHAHELHAASGLALRLTPSVAWVQTEHCAFDHGPSPAKARILWQTLSGGMNSIVTVSRATGEALCRNTGIARNRVRTIFNGVDVSLLPAKDPNLLRIELDVSQDAMLIGSVGRMAPQKGWMDFLAVADDLARRIPHAHFVMIGDGPDSHSLRSELEKRDWKVRAHFLGGRRNAVALLGGMDLFLFTSIHEELPTTLLEAFAMRTPVAGYIPEGGVAEILEHAGNLRPALLQPKRDPRLLADEIQRLLNDPAEQTKMIESASRLVSVFDMSAITRQLESEYVRVAGEGS